MIARSSNKQPDGGLIVRLRNVLIWCCLLGISTLVCVILPFDRKRTLYKRLSYVGSLGMLHLAGITLEVRGREHINLSVPSVYVSNHASMMDMCCLIAGVSKELGFLYKEEMHSIPIFGWALRFGRFHFPIHRGNNAIAVAELQNVVGGLRKGRSVLVFAEGSRTRNGQIQQFKDGAFYLAMKAHTSIVPITIRGTYEVLPSESRCVQPGKVLIIIDRPIAPGSKEFGVARDELKEIVHNRIKANYVAEMAKSGGVGEKGSYREGTGRAGIDWRGSGLRY